MATLRLEPARALPNIGSIANKSTLGLETAQVRISKGITRTRK